MLFSEWVVIAFVFGTTIGSFLGVVADRYDPDKFLFSLHRIGGRSRCETCARTLSWKELIPLASFFLQGRRCAVCREKLSWKYPAVEFLTGFIFAIVASRVPQPPLSLSWGLLMGLLWAVVFSLLIVITFIDLRLQLIPDEANIVIAVAGFAMVAIAKIQPGLMAVSSFGPSGFLLGFEGGSYANRFLAAGFAALFFGALIAVTRGRGMGMGDLKLAIAMAFVFGWPDIGGIILLAFIIGGAVAAGLLIKHRATMKSLVPFGPFLVTAAFVVFLYGEDIMRAYLAYL